MEINKIYNEDCLIGLRNRIEDNSIDLTLTSPPYDNMRDYNGIVKQWSFDKFKSIADELYRVTKDGGVVVWVVNDGVEDGSESGTSFRQALYFKEIGFRLHDTMIYQKANYIPLTHRRYEQSFEYMFVFSKGRPKTFNPIKIPCKGAGRVESNGESRRGTLDGKQAMRGNGKAVLITKDEKIHPNIFCYTVGVREADTQRHFRINSLKTISSLGAMRVIWFLTHLWGVRRLLLWHIGMDVISLVSNSMRNIIK